MQRTASEVVSLQFFILHSSFFIPHSSFLIPHSSFLIPHSSFLIPHSSFLIPHSSFLIPRASLIVYNDGSQSFYEQLVTSSITRAEKKNSEMVALSQTWKLATQQPPSAQITRQTPLQRKTSLATPIRMVLLVRNNGADKFTITRNQQWSVTALTDAANGTVLERYTYDHFGKRTILEANGTTVRAVSTYSMSFGYTSRQHDSETGLVYVRARYYDPATAEFTSPDPLEFVDGMSFYRGYFALVGVDPSGFSLHHWIPQSLIGSFGNVCSKELGEMETRGGDKVTATMISDSFVTETNFGGWGGWGKGSLHYCIEHESSFGNYHDEVEKILKGSKTCCDALEAIQNLMNAVWNQCLNQFFCNSQPWGPPPLKGPYPRVQYPRPPGPPGPPKPTFGTDKYFDALLGAFCRRNRRPRHPFSPSGGIIDPNINETTEIWPGVYVPSKPVAPTIGPRNGPITIPSPRPPIIQESIDMAAELGYPPQTCGGTGSGGGRRPSTIPQYKPQPKPRLQRTPARCCR